MAVRAGCVVISFDLYVEENGAEYVDPDFLSKRLAGVAESWCRKHKLETAASTPVSVQVCVCLST